MNDLLLRDVRVVAIDDDPKAPVEPVDVLVRDGVIVTVAPGLGDVPGVPVLDGGGRHVVPGLWDQHGHMLQWGGLTRLLDWSDKLVRRVIEDGCRRRYASVMLYLCGHTRST